MTDQNQFLFACCQVGAETVCKQELLGRYPDFRFAFSRPGFLTFKVPTGTDTNSFILVSTFARTWGWSLGKCSGDDSQQLVADAIEIAGECDATVIHCWQRDTHVPGDRNFEPGISPLAQGMGELLLVAMKTKRPQIQLNRRAKPGEHVLDVVLVEPNQWWIGWHASQTIPQSWPGGVPIIEDDGPKISRAWLKACEAILWGQVPIRPNDVCLEIGSAPGGAAQHLLERGAMVVAVDPGELDPEIATHKNLIHIRRRAKSVSRKDVADARWLFVDVNMPPSYSLELIADFATNSHMHLRGVVATLKLSNWELATQIDDFRNQVKDLGFSVVRTRQLAFNRQEFCLVALRNKFERRLAPGKSSIAEKGEKPNAVPTSEEE